MAYETTFEQLELGKLAETAWKLKRGRWHFVQMFATNTEAGIDLTYSFQKGVELANYRICGVKEGDVVESITPHYLAAFVFENEAHDLFGVDIANIAIDFDGNFYALASKKPMTVISPEQKAAREKAAKLAAAKAAKEKAAKEGAEAPAASADAEMEAKLAGMDPEKAAKVRAAMEAKAKKTAAKAAEGKAGE